MRHVLRWSSLVAAACGGPALAAESVTYSYDVHGRLITAARSGSVNNGVTSTITHDKVDNRVSYTIAGSPVGAGVIVLPLPGSPVIPVGRQQ